MNPLIYGKDGTQFVVSIEVGDNEATLFLESAEGVTTKTVPNSHYLLFTEQHSDKFKRLVGDQPYRWLYETDSRAKWSEVMKASYKKGYDFHVIRDAKEALMVKDGYTYFKGMTVDQVSTLSFDIETNGLTHNKDSCVFLISNTFRRNGKIERKLFSLDEHADQRTMIAAWCDWVRLVNPSILVGHNIFSFDIPYLQHCAGSSLKLGRDGSALQISDRTSHFRKDGSQSYDYNNVTVFGREIVDTFFLSIKYDVARNYESYALKAIIKHENLERPGREHYDASTIRTNWHDETERAKIKTYAIDDADDSLKLYDLMIPSYFYYTQSVPRSLQWIINSSTGSQINSLMVRAYLQQGHSIAKGDPKESYDGAISLAIPGIHKNVLRLDVSSLYPSVIRQYKIYCRDKDPKGLFLELVSYFTEERLRNKRLAKETGERRFKDLQESQKIAINSMYGFLGTSKLNYNYFAGADQTTAHGRRILKQAIKWATGKEWAA